MYSAQLLPRNQHRMARGWEMGRPATPMARVTKMLDIGHLGAIRTGLDPCRSVEDLSVHFMNHNADVKSVAWAHPEQDRA